MILLTAPYNRNAVNREGFKPEKNHKVLEIIELDQNCGSSYSLGLILFFLTSLLKKIISTASSAISFISAPETNA